LVAAAAAAKQHVSSKLGTEHGTKHGTKHGRSSLYNNQSNRECTQMTQLFFGSDSGKSRHIS